MTTADVASGASAPATARGGARGSMVAPGRAREPAVGAGEAQTAVAPGKVPAPRHEALTANVAARHGLTLGNVGLGDSHALINTVVVHGLRLGNTGSLRLADPPNATVAVS